MKKKLLAFSVILTFILASAFSSLTYAAMYILDELALTFNNCKTVQSIMGNNYLWSATADGYTFSIEIQENDSKTVYEFTYSGSILSALVDFEGLFPTMVLADCVGQLNGYEDGELLSTLNSEEITEYTVEDEGFEIKEVAEGIYEVKMDISKKIPLVDISKIYLKTDDFDILKKIVEDGEPGNQTGYKMKMAYNVSVDSDGNAEIVMGEKDEITESTYKSILSAIEVLFGDTKAVEYFVANYESMAEGNKEFAGFKVEVNLGSDELSAPEGTKISKVTVDREAAVEAMKTMYNTELSNAVAKAEDIMNNRTENYTQDSLAMLRDAMIDGIIFLNEKTNDEAKAKELVNAINDAIEALEKEYTLEGANQNFKLEEGKHLTFKFDIDYNDFLTYGDVWLDEQRIEEDNYTAESGSTIITFKDEFTKTLAEGGHHLEIALAQGRLGIAKTDFTIEKVDSTSADKTQKSNTSNPKTGDNILIFAGIAVLALAGLSLTYYNIKKK